jgi:hypothetical protein
MDDLTARLARVEITATDTRADVASIKATLPHLATKADLGEMKAELKAQIERVDGNVARLEASMIKWIVGSVLAGIGLAVTAARLVS